MSELVKQGKVRVIGCSNFTAERTRESLAASHKNGWPRYESLQPNYNLYERATYETTLEPLAMREKLGVIPYYSLAAGFLTGKYRSLDDLSKSPRGQGVFVSQIRSAKSARKIIRRRIRYASTWSLQRSAWTGRNSARAESRKKYFG